MVLVNATVSDLQGRLVACLERQHFRLWENEVEQQVTAFSMADSVISAGIVFDTSGSMHNHITESRDAIDQFLKTAGPGDQHFLVRFADNPQLVTPLTLDPDEISQHLREVQPHGWTAMNDAIVLSLREMKRASYPRRVLLVFTDGDQQRAVAGFLFGAGDVRLAVEQDVLIGRQATHDDAGLAQRGGI